MGGEKGEKGFKGGCRAANGGMLKSEENGTSLRGGSQREGFVEGANKTPKRRVIARGLP